MCITRAPWLLPRWGGWLRWKRKSIFHAARDRVPEGRLLHNNKVRDLLGIATEMLRGEIEYRKGNFDVAFCAGRSRSTMRFPMTNPGAGCSRRGMHWGRFCSNKGALQKPKWSIAKTSALAGS